MLRAKFNYGKKFRKPPPSTEKGKGVVRPALKQVLTQRNKRTKVTLPQVK